MAFYFPDFAGHLSCRAEPALSVGAQHLQHPDRRVHLWGDGRGYDAGFDLSVGAILAFSAIMNVSPYYQQIIIGIIIVLAVGAGVGGEVRSCSFGPRSKSRVRDI